MAYDATISLVETQQGGRGPRPQVAVVQETDIDPADASNEFEISVPKFCTVTLQEVELSTVGDAATIQPEFGTTSQWNVDEIGDGVPAAAAATYHRLQTPVRVYAPEGKLFFRSKPNVATGVAGVVDWRITVEQGHGS